MSVPGASSRSTWLRELLLLGAAVGVGLLVGRFVLATPDGEQPPTVPGSGRASAGDSELDEHMQAAPLAEGRSGAGFAKTGTPPEGAAVFPDGTWLEPINGVEKAPPFPDQAGWFFSPVVRIHTEQQTGLQWYIHQNGEVSTVYDVHHETPDRKWVEPGWVLGKPTKTQPVR